MNDLNEKLSRVSSNPGVYLMKNLQGEIIYVGKARNLKKRLANYFHRPAHTDVKTGVLVKQIADFETIITGTEAEALILESNLIKRHRPRYNVILKDDKRYPVLRLDTRRDYPNLTVARKIRNDGALYFGPYAAPGAVRKTLKFIHKTFKIRKCRSQKISPRGRPCLHCQIEGCLAPCCMDVHPDDYRQVIREVVLFLKGRTPELVSELKRNMLEAAEKQEFESAAKIRDKIQALEKTLEKQVSVTTDFVDRDVLGLAGEQNAALITQLVVRSGFLIGSKNFYLEENLDAPSELLGAFIKQKYDQVEFIPKEILIPFSIEDHELLGKWLSEKKEQRVTIHRPQRGEKARLVRMAMENAKQALGEKKVSEKNKRELLKALQKALHMNNIPARIECFDNSNISGTQAVAAMTVFENGAPKKSDYRTYKIKTVEKHDDYGYMKEVLARRYAKGGNALPYPDLLVVDGGKGQLNIARAVLNELELSDKFLVIGIAKKDESKGEDKDKIFAPGRSNPLNISGPPYLLLQKIRDETHRCAIAFHRKRRKKASLHSVLDDIPGIGPKRKRALLKYFKTVTNIRKASVSQLNAIPEMNKTAAKLLHQTLASEPNPDQSLQNTEK